MEQEYVTIKKAEDIPDVREVPVEVLEQGTDYKAIVETDTNETLSIVSDKYQLTPHSSVWAQVKTLGKFKVTRAQLYKYGNAMIIEIRDKVAQNIEVMPGDLIERQVRVINTYDLTRALSVQSIGLRLVCKNGAMAPGMVERFRKSHTYNNIDVNEIGKYVELSMEAWAKSGELLRLSAKQIVESKPTVEGLKFPKKYTEIILEKLDKKNDIYTIWNATTETITKDIAPNIQTAGLLEFQYKANSVFQLVKRKVA